MKLLRPVMPELNSLRGLACLAVLFFHGLWWYIPQTASGFEGWVRDVTSQWHRGVGFFFVLSGLLITNILLDSKDRLDYFSRFYKRRALRILPAYYMILIALAIAGVSWQFLSLSFVYLSNMAPMLKVQMGYGPLWSLAVEEQFYLLWPILVRRFNTRTLVFVLVGVIVNSMILALQITSSSPQKMFPLWMSAHGLALGALLALFLRSIPSERNVWRLAFVLVFVGNVLRSISVVTKNQMSLMTQGFGYDAYFAAILLVALLIGSSKYEAWLRPRVLQFFGDISYGLYLVHVLVFDIYRNWFHTSVFVQFAVCSIVSILVATLSRYTVEEWFLHLKDRPLLPVLTLRRV